jgi:cytochrome c
MKSVFISAAVSVGLLVSASAFAAESEGMALAKASGCLGCHAVDHKLVGPAYQDVAKKRTKADAAMLEAKVKKGGSGVYGPVPMPPNAAVSDANIKKLVAWVLAGAK